MGAETDVNLVGRITRSHVESQADGSNITVIDEFTLTAISIPSEEQRAMVLEWADDPPGANGVHRNTAGVDVPWLPHRASAP